MKQILLLAVSFVVAAAAAQTYTYQFSGHVTDFSPQFADLAGDIQIDQTFTGWFSYHLEPYDGFTLEQDASMVLTVGDFQLSHLDDRTLVFLHDLPKDYHDSESYDFFRVNAYGTQGDIEYWRTGISFTDSTRTTFDTNDTLPNNLNLSMFDAGGVVFGFNSDDHGSMSGVIDSLTMVPEPTSMVILLCGGLVLRLRSR